MIGVLESCATCQAASIVAVAVYQGGIIVMWLQPCQVFGFRCNLQVSMIGALLVQAHRCIMALAINCLRPIAWMLKQIYGFCDLTTKQIY